MRYFIILFLVMVSFGCQSGPKAFKTNLKKKKLLNGIEVLSFKDKSLPFFKIVVWSPHGSAYEPKEQQGVTRMVANLLAKGTEEKSKDQIDKEFSSLGSSFQSSVGIDSVVFAAQSLTEDSFELTKLFTEVLLEPKFENKSILDLKGKTLAELKRLTDSPQSLSGLAFSQVMFQDHGYSRLSAGTLDSVNSLRRNNILKRYNQIFDTKDLKIIFIGNWMEDAETYILSRLTDLEKGVEEASLDRIEVSEKTKSTTVFHKKDLQQANVLMGLSAISRDSVDYEALKVGMFILGGSFKSRLNQELRIKRGLTYGVRSGVQALQDGGLLKVSGAVRHDKVYEFIREAQKILADAAANGVTQEELDKAKAIMRGQFPRGVETKEDEAGAYLDLMSRGVQGEELYTYLNKVLSLNLTEVNDALRKYLRMERMNTIVLANKYKIPSKDLKKLGAKHRSYRAIKL